jgi:hypothetical protein
VEKIVCRNFIVVINVINQQQNKRTKLGRSKDAEVIPNRWIDLKSLE